MPESKPKPPVIPDPASVGNSRPHPMTEPPASGLPGVGSNFYLQSMNAPSMGLDEVIHVSRIVDDLRAEGFADCEELVAGMLERMAERVGEADPAGRSLLLSAALAVRLGQHRNGEVGT
jgi:hypothetical protein